MSFLLCLRSPEAYVARDAMETKRFQRIVCPLVGGGVIGEIEREERFLTSTGRPFAGAKGKKESPCSVRNDGVRSAAESRRTVRDANVIICGESYCIVCV